MLIDTHSHLNFNAFLSDGEEVIRRSLNKEILMINVGSEYRTSKRAVEIAEKYKKGVYAAVGLHPIHLMDVEADEEEVPFKAKKEEFDKEKYLELAQSKKVVAIGECGLDYYYIANLRESSSQRMSGSKSLIKANNNVASVFRSNQIKDLQKQTFIKHLKLAADIGKPVILHCRGSKKNPQDAYYKMINLLKTQSRIKCGTKLKTNKGVIHCFGATRDVAQKFLDLGFYIGFTGIITFDKAQELQEVVKNVPLERILVETDAPYLAPKPYRGKRCLPEYVEFVARKVGEIKGISFEEVAEVTTKNAKELFKLA